MISPTPRWLAAFHESGHCVIALALGNQVAEVEVRDDGGGLCRQGPPVRIADQLRAERFYIITCAGQIAAARRFGAIGRSGSGSDYCLLRERTSFDDSERGALWRIAERLVERNWPAVCLIAQELHRAGRLDRRQIIELLSARAAA
jgi:hypothetical protein